MYKQEFLAALRQGLNGLPQDDVEERVAFYAEMIDDRMEEGLSEEAAVAEIGPIDAIVSQTLSDIPITKLVREKVRPKRQYHAWEIVLIVLGFPLWFPLLVTVFAVILTAYVVIWAIILSLWAAVASIAVTAIACIAAGVIVLCGGSTPMGLLAIAAGLVLAGLTIFLFFAMKAVTVGAVWLTKKIALGIKSLFVRKENAK